MTFPKKEEIFFKYVKQMGGMETCQQFSINYEIMTSNNILLRITIHLLTVLISDREKRKMIK